MPNSTVNSMPVTINSKIDSVLDRMLNSIPNTRLGSTPKSMPNSMAAAPSPWRRRRRSSLSPKLDHEYVVMARIVMAYIVMAYVLIAPSPRKP